MIELQPPTEWYDKKTFRMFVLKEMVVEQSEKALKRAENIQKSIENHIDSTDYCPKHKDEHLRALKNGLDFEGYKSNRCHNKNPLTVEEIRNKNIIKAV